MKFLKLHLLILLFLCPTSLVWAQNITAAEASQYCRIFVETPEKFQKLESSPCEIFPYKYSTEKRQETCLEFNDQTYVSRFDGGTCGSSGIYLLKNEDKKEYGAHIPIGNVTVNGYRMGSFDKLFSFNDLLFVSGGNDLRIIEDNKQYVLCQLYYEFKSFEKPDSENPICQNLAKGNFKEISTPVSVEEAVNLGWQVPKQPPASLTPHAHTSIDLDNDNIEENIFYYSFSSGSGCGCNYESVTISPNPDNKKLEISNRCGAYKTIIAKINDTPYLLQTLKARHKYPRHFGGKTDIPNQSLYKIENNKTVKICEQKPILKRVLDKDFKAEELQSRHHTYIPIK